MAQISLKRAGLLLPLGMLLFTGCSNCAETTGAEALADAATQIEPAWEGLDADSPDNWDLGAADVSTYDACKPLSWIVIPTHEAGKDDPYQVVLFHDGIFSRAAEARPYLGMPAVTRVSDKEIQVERTWYVNGDKNKPKPAVATYVWDNEHSRTVRTGGLPPNEYAAGGPQETAGNN